MPSLSIFPIPIYVGVLKYVHTQIDTLFTKIPLTRKMLIVKNTFTMIFWQLPSPNIVSFCDTGGISSSSSIPNGNCLLVVVLFFRSTTRVRIKQYSPKQYLGCRLKFDFLKKISDFAFPAKNISIGNQAFINVQAKIKMGFNVPYFSPYFEQVSLHYGDF